MRRAVALIFVLAACSQATVPSTTTEPADNATTTSPTTSSPSTTSAATTTTTTVPAPPTTTDELIDRLEGAGIQVLDSNLQHKCHLGSMTETFEVRAGELRSFSVDTFASETDVAAAAAALPACPALIGATVDVLGTIHYWIMGTSIVTHGEGSSGNRMLADVLDEILGPPLESMGPIASSDRRRAVAAEIHEGQGNAVIVVDRTEPLYITLINPGGPTPELTVLDDAGERIKTTRPGVLQVASTTVGLDGRYADRLQVTAESDWIVELRPALEFAEPLTGTRTGWSSDVIVLDEPLEQPTLIRVAHHGEGVFQVRVVDVEHAGSAVVLADGVFSGGTVLHEGTIAIEVIAEGAWAISALDTINLDPVVPPNPGRRWYRTDGSELPPFPEYREITLMSGAEHCGWQDTDWLILTQTIIAELFYESSLPHWSFVRWGPELSGINFASDYEPETILPPNAIHSGYEDEAGWELWIVPDDDTSVYIVKPTGIEKWPRPNSYAAYCY